MLGEWSGHYTQVSAGWEAGVRIKLDTVPAVGDSIDIHYIHQGAQGNYETAEVKEAGFAYGKLRVVLEGMSVTGEGLCLTRGKQTFAITADSFVFALEDSDVLMTKAPAAEVIGIKLNNSVLPFCPRVEPRQNSRRRSARSHMIAHP